jgi:hypothetical protein
MGWGVMMTQKYLSAATYGIQDSGTIIPVGVYI